jgi:hypothetical protein
VAVLREELVHQDAANNVSQLRRRANLTPTHGALALKPPQDE